MFLSLFVLAMVGQTLTGKQEYNQERKEELHLPPVGLLAYLRSGHFIQSTFENWESEFLQMGLFVLLTISLRQKGSSESKECEGEEEVDREPSAQRKGAPWPVRKGGWILAIYRNSLSIAFFLLFLISVCLHFAGSLKDENEKLVAMGQSAQTVVSYLGEPRFWFESFQNWQSEFLSVFCVVMFSIYLRQKGSPQSKPVDASNSETGE